MALQRQPMLVLAIAVSDMAAGEAKKAKMTT